MRIENNQEWLEIEFVRYANDDVIRSLNLFDEEN